MNLKGNLQKLVNKNENRRHSKLKKDFKGAWLNKI